MQVLLLFAGSLFAGMVLAQQPAPGREDLDVTMRVIVDPEAKLPDEIVRKIPLPEAARAAGERSGSVSRKNKKEAGDEENEDAGDVGERTREMAREAAQQHEDAGRAIAEEARRNAGGPPLDPGPPQPPPGPPPDPGPPQPPPGPPPDPGPPQPPPAPPPPPEG